MTVYEHPSIRPLRDRRQTLQARLDAIDTEYGNTIAVLQTAYSDTLWGKLGELEMDLRSQRAMIDRLDAEIECKVCAIIA